MHGLELSLDLLNKLNETVKALIKTQMVVFHIDVFGKIFLYMCLTSKSKIRLYVLSSLILIYNVHTYPIDTHFDVSKTDRF